jgi:hypothetical protein
MLLKLVKPKLDGMWKIPPRKIKGLLGVKFGGPYLSGLERIGAVLFQKERLRISPAQIAGVDRAPFFDTSL